MSEHECEQCVKFNELVLMQQRELDRLRPQVSALQARLDKAYEYKYQPGDVVWGISDMSCHKAVECKSCEAGSLRTVDDIVIVCPICQGTCYKPDKIGTKWQVYNDPKEIDYIFIYSDGIKYYADWNFKEKDLFPTQAEAQAECDRRNGQNGGDDE